MSMKLNAGEVGRKDLFSVFPEHIVVVPKENGRVEGGYGQEDTVALAEIILAEGQQTPVEVRRIEDHKIQLVFGYGRHAAISYVNKVLRPDNPMQVLCRVVDCNPEEAFIRNLSENLNRKGTTPIDDAHNQRRLREEYGWTEARIGAFYDKSVAYLSQLRKLPGLAKDIQDGVKAGNIPIEAALLVTELPASEHKEAVTEATNVETGKVSAEVIRKRVRNKRIEAGNGGKGRSLKELRVYFEEQTGPGETVAVRELCKKVLGYIAGKISDKQMNNALAKHTVVCEEDGAVEVTPVEASQPAPAESVAQVEPVASEPVVEAAQTEVQPAVTEAA